MLNDGKNHSKVKNRTVLPRRSPAELSDTLLQLGVLRFQTDDPLPETLLGRVAGLDQAVLTEEILRHLLEIAEAGGQGVMGRRAIGRGVGSR